MSRGPASLVWRDYMNLSELSEKIKSHLDKNYIRPHVFLIADLIFDRKSLRLQKLRRQIHPVRDVSAEFFQPVVDLRIRRRQPVVSLPEHMQFRTDARPEQRVIQQQRVLHRHTPVLRRRPQKDGRRIGPRMLFQGIRLVGHRIGAEIAHGIGVPKRFFTRHDGIGKHRRIGAKARPVPKGKQRAIVP